MMTLSIFVVGIIVCIVGFLLIGLVEDAKAQKILRTVAIILLILWLLTGFGLIPNILNIKLQ